jgi:hypothetical protein
MGLNIQFTNFWDVISCMQTCTNIYSTMKIETAGSFQMLPIYQSTHHIYLFKRNFNSILKGSDGV